MYFDLGLKVRTDGAFRDNLLKRLQEIKRIDSAEGGTDSRGKLRNAVFDTWEFCRYNASALVPFYFPRSDKKSALQLLDRPYTIPFMDLRAGSSVTAVTGRQVGKSSTLIIRNKMMSDLLPNYATLYIAPHPNHVDTFKNRYKKMEAWFKYPAIESKKFRQNLGLKEWSNGSTMKMIHALDDATPIRGNTADEVQIDEYQNFDPNHEFEILPVIKSSDWKFIMRTGTALTLDNGLSVEYDHGSQGRWMVRCPFGHYTNMGLAEHVLSCIKPDGMYCVPCQKKQHKTKINPLDGFYDHANMAQLENGVVSLHAPQLIVPAYVTDIEEWLTIYNDFVRFPEHRFLQEVCGIPTESGTRELAVQDLIAMCDPEAPSYEDRLRKARNGYYRWVISGCDWGGSDYQSASSIKESYTYHCIIGMTPDGRIDILHFEQHSGMDFPSIALKIATIHKMFRGTALASDFGVGQAYNMLIRKHMPATRHFIFNYTGPNTAAIAEPAFEHMFNQFSLNKTESLTTTFLAIKSLSIRCFRWQEASRHLMQFLNLIRIPQDTESGAKFKYVRHGAKPDDSLHALNFAFALLRTLTGEGIVVDPSLKAEIHRRVQTGAAEHAGLLGYPSNVGHYAG